MLKHHATKMYGGGDIKFDTFLPLAVDGVEWPRTHSGHSTALYIYSVISAVLI
jgi:hypothetical protein